MSDQFLNKTYDKVGRNVLEKRGMKESVKPNVFNKHVNPNTMTTSSFLLFIRIISTLIRTNIDIHTNPIKLLQVHIYGTTCLTFQREVPRQVKIVSSTFSFFIPSVE